MEAGVQKVPGRRADVKKEMVLKLMAMMQSDRLITESTCFPRCEPRLRMFISIVLHFVLLPFDERIFWMSDFSSA